MTHLRVLGSSPAWYNKAVPASGYLLVHRKESVLIDCGSACLTTLSKIPEKDLSLQAVILSHAHADHSLDLVPLKYDIDFGERSGQKIGLFLTEDSKDRLCRLASAFSDDDPISFWTPSFDLESYESGSSFSIGAFAFEALAVPHFIPTCALKATTPTGKVLVYTADTGEGGLEGLALFCQGCDLLLCEAAIPSACPKDHPVRAGHIDPIQAAKLAENANAKSLLLTHIPDAYLPEQALLEAREYFRGHVELAYPKQLVSLG